MHDLEQVLGIEAARTGEATGEATTILRSLPGRHRRLRARAPAPPAPRARRRGDRARAGGRRDRVRGHAHREGRRAAPSRPSARGLSEVRLGSSAATDYDPQGDSQEYPSATQYAIDGQLPTNWQTETYENGVWPNEKTGVGLYVDAGQAAPRTPARRGHAPPPASRRPCTARPTACPARSTAGPS